jgi:hypothetical protein
MPGYFIQSILLTNLTVGGIPVFERGAFGLCTLSGDRWTMGEPNPFTKTWNAAVPITVGPHQTILVTATVTEGELEVPFIITFSSKSTGVKTQMHGVWRGTSSWDIHYDVRET